MKIPLICLRRAGLVLFCILLGACGGDSAPVQQDPWASFTQQQLHWEACDSTIMGQGENDLTVLGARAQCALMRAPLDYANPALGELQVALLKVAAEKTEQRLGAIFFNPGGPGGDGLGFAPLYGVLWSNANPADASGKLFKELSNRYDLIGFSPRGVGASSTLMWSSPELLENQNPLSFDRSAQNIRNAQRNARLLVKAGAKNPLTQYINTDATARDMDLMRELLGDSKINYIGYSYGTWLGAWYAGLFPERVGNMLLDSSVNITQGFSEIFLSQEMGFQRIIDEVILPYAVSKPELFNLGSNAADLRNRLLALPLNIKSALFYSLDYSVSIAASSNVLFINAALGLQDLLDKKPEIELSEILQEITNYEFSASLMHNLQTAARARWLLYYLFSENERSAINVSPSTAVNISVRCNDMRASGDEQYWVDIGNDSVARYPFTGGRSTAQPCIYWTAPIKANLPFARASQAGPLLMLQSRYDGLTPIEGAQATFAALPNASMIVVESEYSHGLFPYGQACVDAQVAHYFLAGQLPARWSSCAGKPLQDVFSQPAGADASASQSTTAAKSVGTYKNAAQAQSIMARIHAQIRKANQDFSAPQMLQAAP